MNHVAILQIRFTDFKPTELQRKNKFLKNYRTFTKKKVNLFIISILSDISSTKYIDSNGLERSKYLVGVRLHSL